MSTTLLRHFLRKCKVCYGLGKHKHNFITEARLMRKLKCNGRRVDIEYLTTGKETEIETDRKKLNSKGHISILA